MKTKSTLLFFGLLFGSVNSYAQTSTIKGMVVDSLTSQGEPYVTIRVYKERKSDKPLAMWVTNIDGTFTHTVNGQGNFFISFSSMGRKDIIRNVQLSATGGEIDLGKLLIQDNAKQLKGVEVVAQKPLVKMETDKMAYDVQADNDSKASTVLDMLRKVPMVIVDGQDNITVNGQSSFKVYVDGKPSVMFSSNPSQVFKAMPASMVKSIEVITNPGAKYDAEGVGGVLNIVMNASSNSKMSKNGYNGNVSLTAAAIGLRLSSFISGQQGKFSYSANIMNNRGRVKGVETEMERIASDGSRMIYNQTGSTRMPFTMANVSLGYEIDSVSNVNATLGVTQFEMNNDGHPTTTFTGGSYGTGFSYSNAMTMKNVNNSYNGSLDYQRFLNRNRTSSITLSYLFTTSPARSENRRIYDPVSALVTIPLADLYSEAKTRGTEHTLQVDYITPLSKTQQLNTGVKYINRRSTSDSRFYDIVGSVEQYDPAKSVNYKNLQSVLAEYAEYKVTLKNVSAKAGLRYEYTWESVDFVLGAGSNFKKNYGNLVPSASVTYNLSPTKNIGVNYGMRITRPGITYLNPYVDRSNPTIIIYGNSDLEVEKTHNINLVYNTFSRKFMANFTLGTIFANNKIEEYSFMQSGILNRTYGNIVQSKSFNFNTFMNYSLSKNTRIMLNLNLEYADLKSAQLNQHNSGWMATAYLGLQQTLPWDLKWNVNLTGSTTRYTLQGYQTGNNMLISTLSKSLFNDKLSLSLLYLAPLTGKLKIDQYSKGHDFETTTRIRIPLQNLMFTVSWNFGNTKKTFQQRTSKITNDFQEREDSNSQVPGLGAGSGKGM
ncbi:outer membrane beta-barrel family protein [Hoylesella nanceiensis]|uniref:outer membrane beta-barrel family protein n=1 Tax=Hoylesella nanceiensis TaxID=425941 RepID=UPI001CB49C5C|nr:outer membrane beta-barrel family protein [Hoylesella nanceiensis]MBF1421422.1 TonB-dependent receptor [Hoylesella nanceiensis]